VTVLKKLQMSLVLTSFFFVTDIDARTRPYMYGRCPGSLEMFQIFTETRF